MPFPNEHAARVVTPGKFTSGSFRRKNIAPGIDIIIGKLKGKTTTTTQAYRFNKDKFTEAEAKQWLKDNNVKFILFEPATNPPKSKTVKKADEETKENEVTRLTKIFVDEVSIVDVPANNKPFLVVKRNQINPKKGGNEMSDDVVTKKDDETEVPAENSAETPEATETQKGEGGNKGSQEATDGTEVLVLEAEKAEGNDDEETETTKANDDTEEAGEATPTTPSEVVKGTIAQLESIIVTEGVPDEVKNTVHATIKSLGRLKSKGTSPEPTPSKKEESQETKKSGEVTDGENEVSKAGRKISSARLGKIKAAQEAVAKATETLTTLLKELDGGESKEAKKSDDVTDDGNASEAIPAPVDNNTTDVAAEVSKAVAKSVTETMKSIKDEIMGKVDKLGERMEVVEQVRPASKSIEGKETETQKSQEDGGIFTGVFGEL